MEQEQGRFAGQNVWVTGAYQGIGAAIAAAFSAAGAHVLRLDRQGEHIKIDLREPASISAAVQECRRQQPRIDVLVNAAGVLHPGKVSELKAADLAEMWAVNVVGACTLMQLVMPVFKAQRHGVIINIGSNAARVPRLALAGYGATKAALASLSHSTALELAPYGVRCNLVSPGSTDTPMLRQLAESPAQQDAIIHGAPADYRLGIPLGKIAQPSDIAAAVLFLASAEAAQITMHELVVDGGASLGA